MAAVDGARAGLRSEGCAVLGGFVRSEAVVRLNEEILERKHATHYSTQVMNPYFHTAANPDFPADHPVNTFIERSSGFIPGDAWDPGCATDTLFRAPEVSRFIADCLEIPALYCYDDPLAGLTSNICDPGQQFTWHFDTNDYAVTVLVQPADEGGLFEYVPRIRSADDEGFNAIAGVLAGRPGGGAHPGAAPRRSSDLQGPLLASPGHSGRSRIPAPPRGHLRLHAGAGSDRQGGPHPPTLRPGAAGARGSRAAESPLRRPARLSNGACEAAWPAGCLDQPHNGHNWSRRRRVEAWSGDLRVELGRH